MAVDIRDMDNPPTMAAQLRVVVQAGLGYPGAC